MSRKLLSRARRILRVACVAIAGSFALASGPAGAADNGPKWQGQLPGAGRDAAAWGQTLDALLTADLPYGAMATARHMIALFADVATRQRAYRAVITLIDEGYPISAASLFDGADLEPEISGSPEAYRFANNYYLYKAMVTQGRGSERWTNYYLSKVDRDNFPKYVYFRATQAYEKGDLPGAAELVRKAMSKDLGNQPRNLVMKMTRTLARIYFEQKEYEKSLEIYDSVLLKLNPIAPGDWLEAAWNLYYLKRYPEALGYLYNLESMAGRHQAAIEKFNIRALIYRAMCAVPEMDELIRAFDRVYGPVLRGIRRGEPLASFATLRDLELPENAAYDQARRTLDGLSIEAPRARSLPAAAASLAANVYDTEYRLVAKRAKGLAAESLDRAAAHILLVAEQMRFLRFDIQRSRFDPDSVFKPTAEPVASSFVEATGERMETHWVQFGDFWLDERPRYRGTLKDRCGT